MLYRAPSTNDAQQDGDDGDNQQNVNDATSEEVAEEANSPDDDQNNGDDIQQVAHGLKILRRVEGR